jgi:hypothetical protein
VFCRQLTHGTQKLGGRNNQVHVADHGFDDNCGDLGAMFGESVSQLLWVVVGEDHGVLRQIGWYAAGGRVAES